MTDVVKNWILKANNDFKTGKDEMATEEPGIKRGCRRLRDKKVPSQNVISLGRSF